MQTVSAEVVQQQVQSLLRQDLPWLLMGAVLLTLSASALALFGLRWKARDLALLWFGLFSGLYAARLLAGVRTVRMLFDLHPGMRALKAGVLILGLFLLPGLRGGQPLVGL